MTKKILIDEAVVKQAIWTLERLGEASDTDVSPKKWYEARGWPTLEALEAVIVDQKAAQVNNKGVNALTEQQAAEPVAWQPIETAPKDGRKLILFYLNSNNKARTVMARWLTDEEAAETDGDGVGLNGGWYECIDNWGDYTEVVIHEGDPSHWMPLPKAPAARSITGSKEGGAA